MAPLHPVHVSSPFCHFYLLLERLISLLFKNTKPLEDFSNLSNSLLQFIHKTDEEVLSLLTGNPSTDDNFAAIFCSLECAPSNKLNFPYPDIINYMKIYITHSAKIIYTIYTIYRRQSFHRSYRNTAHEICHPSI